jgi:hypothetical protein
MLRIPNLAAFTTVFVRAPDVGHGAQHGQRRSARVVVLDRCSSGLGHVPARVEAQEQPAGMGDGGQLPRWLRAITQAIEES